MLRPTGFVASDYAIAVWGLGDLGLAACAARPLRPAQAVGTPDRDVSARRALLHGCVSVRGPAGTPDAGNAAHAPPRAGQAAPDRIRRQRLRDRSMGPGRPRSGF